MTNVFQLETNMKASINRRTFIVADERWLVPLRGELDGIQEIEFVPLGEGDDLPDNVLQSAELLVLEVSDAEGMRRVERFRRANPEAPIIAALETADLATMRALLRHEVRNVVALPFVAEELVSQLVETVASHAPKGSAPLAPLVSFTGAGGGAGATSLLLHLAHALVDLCDEQVRCCVVDLDMQFGDVAHYSGAEAAGSVGSLLEAGTRLDGHMLRDVVTPVHDGVHVLVAPAEMLPIDDIDIDQLLRIVSLARREFDFVLVDLPSAWTNWSLSVAAGSDEIFVVTKQDLSHLRHAHRCLAMFDDIGLERGKVKLVINQVARSLLGSISVKDVEEALSRNAAGWLPRDNGDLAAALDQGELLSSLSPRSQYVKKVNSLAEGLLDRLEVEEA